MARDILEAMTATDAAAPDYELLYRIDRFLNHEAELMDEHQHEQWLALWDGEDIRYWVPANRDDQDPELGLAIIYDDRRRLEERIARMMDPTSHTYNPRPRVMRVVGNVVVLDDDGETLRVASSAAIGQINKGHQHVWFAKVIHTLVRRGAGFAIRAKKVMLLNNDEPMPNLNFLV